MAYTVYRPAQKKIRAVIFDMDGVVLDTEKLYARFWREAAVALGWPMTHRQALGMRSLNKQAGQAKLEEFFGPGVSHEAVRRKRIELMDAFVAEHGVEAMPGVRETVTALRQMGYAIAMATSSPRQRAERYLASVGLLDCFPVICTGYDVEKGKPAPDIYQKAAQMIAVPPENCLAIEDSVAGILSASRAGCLPVFIPDQDGANGEIQPLLYGSIESLTDIPDILKEEQL